jgi:hypothetical protein
MLVSFSGSRDHGATIGGQARCDNAAAESPRRHCGHGDGSGRMNAARSGNRPAETKMEQIPFVI